MKVLFKTGSDPALLILRVALGTVMFAHGAQKVLGWFGGAGFEKSVEIFTRKLGFPFLLAVVIILTEFLGSLGLIMGFLTRISALGIGVVDQSLQQILANPVLGKILVLVGIILFLQWKPSGLFVTRSRSLDHG